MEEQKTALYHLIHTAGLSVDEVANLTLGDLALSGAEPLIHVWDEKTGGRRHIPIEEKTRNALVAWLLVRPDRPAKLLFYADDDEGLTPTAIEGLLAGFVPAGGKDAPPVTAHTIQTEKLPNVGPLPGRQGPPPFKVAPPPRSGPERVSRPKETPAPAGPPEPIPSAAPPAEKSPEPSQSSEPAKAPGQPEKATPPAAGLNPKTIRTAALALGGLAALACLGLIIAGVIFLPGQLARWRGQPEVAAVTSTPAAPAGASTEALPTDTPAPTDTPVPTATNTPEPPTATPAPSTDTPTPLPTNPPATEPPTNTPEPPTATPEPPATDTPVPAAAPVQPAAPTATPTVGLKYAAPELISPEPDYVFIQGNTLELSWKPVGELAENEQYAVRLVYSHNAELVYRGGNVKETKWTVPMSLYHDADGPEYLHTWYVYVEAVQPDGSGLAISPESERRKFVWN